MNNSKILLVFFIVTVFASSSFAQRNYTITEIQTPANVSGMGLRSINNKAEVVGSANFEHCVENEQGGGTSRATLKSTSKTGKYRLGTESWLH